jgi:hypothetical protein
MKKIFLFLLALLMICGCQKPDKNDDNNSTDDEQVVPDDPVNNASGAMLDGYQGNTVVLSYADGTSERITKNSNGLFPLPRNNRIIHSIILDGGITVIAGRKADGSAISLKFKDDNLVFRNAVDGYIPIGTYS